MSFRRQWVEREEVQIMFWNDQKYSYLLFGAKRVDAKMFEGASCSWLLSNSGTDKIFAHFNIILVYLAVSLFNLFDLRSTSLNF